MERTIESVELELESATENLGCTTLLHRTITKRMALARC